MWTSLRPPENSGLHPGTHRQRYELFSLECSRIINSQCVRNKPILRANGYLCSPYSVIIDICGLSLRISNLGSGKRILQDKISMHSTLFSCQKL